METLAKLVLSFKNLTIIPVIFFSVFYYPKENTSKTSPCTSVPSPGHSVKQQMNNTEGHREGTEGHRVLLKCCKIPFEIFAWGFLSRLFRIIFLYIGKVQSFFIRAIVFYITVFLFFRKTSVRIHIFNKPFIISQFEITDYSYYIKQIYTGRCELHFDNTSYALGDTIWRKYRE